MAFALTDEERDFLLRHTRHALLAHLGVENGPPNPTSSDDSPVARYDIGGVFVTLRTDGELRGCIGYVSTVDDLNATVLRAAIAAATSDPRFPSITAEEVVRVRISISVLTQPELVPAPEKPDWFLDGRDGLLIERETDGARGLLLPQVALEHGWSREEFLDAACRKAGLPASSWRSQETIVKRFEALVVSEDD